MSKSALLVIDFINDIVNPDGKLKSCVAYCEQHDVFSKANQAIAWAKQNTVPVIFVKVGFSKNYIECPKSSQVFSAAEQHGALTLGEWGTEFDTRINADQADAVIIKHRVSCFYNTDLETILKANNIDTILLAGVATEMAIVSAAREGLDRDYQMVVLEDACGGRDHAGHDMAISMCNNVAKVIKVAELKL